MEIQDRGKKRRIKKERKRQKASSSGSSRLQQQHADGHTVFAVMLATLSNDNLHEPSSDSIIVINQCLDQLHFSLLSETPNNQIPPPPPPLLIPPRQTIPISILSLIPVLLSSKCAEIASASLKIVRAASLFSFEMNEQIALDAQIVKGLISALASSKSSVSVSACNAVMDLSTTSIGRQQLLEFSAIENLMWEGFAHVALHHWYQNQNISQCTSGDCLSWKLNVMSVNLMHVAIKLIGDLDPTFRKACLVGAVSLSSVTGGWLDMIQRTIFRHLLSRINTESRLLDVLNSVELAIQKHEDPFQHIRWLQHLNKEGEMIKGHNWIMPKIGTENFFHLFSQHKDEAQAVFMQVKSKFCSEVVFEDVEQSYGMLLEKYRKARKQYMNGMLSLHCS